jgi:hypothetical protein
MYWFCQACKCQVGIQLQVYIVRNLFQNGFEGDIKLDGVTGMLGVRFLKLMLAPTSPQPTAPVIVEQAMQLHPALADMQQVEGQEEGKAKADVVAPEEPQEQAMEEGEQDQEGKADEEQHGPVEPAQVPTEQPVPEAAESEQVPAVPEQPQARPPMLPRKAPPACFGLIPSVKPPPAAFLMMQQAQPKGPPASLHPTMDRGVLRPPTKAPALLPPPLKAPPPVPDHVHEMMMEVPASWGSGGAAALYTQGVLPGDANVCTLPVDKLLKFMKDNPNSSMPSLIRGSMCV